MIALAHTTIKYASLTDKELDKEIRDVTQWMSITASSIAYEKARVVLDELNEELKFRIAKWKAARVQK